MPNRKKWRFETRAIHAGQEPEPATGAVMVPIYQTSTYVQEGIGKHKGYQYSRGGNPTRTALESCLASLEGADFGLAFSSGMASVSAVMHLLKPGDHVISSDDVYGGTYRIFDRVLSEWGLSFTFMNVTDAASIEGAIQDNTRLIWVETPTNPLLKLTDIRSICDLSKQRGLTTVVDNTFVSPHFQKPFELGADIVVHSTTKYMGGHSDVVGGAVVTSNRDFFDALKYHQNAVGSIPGPFDCFLTLRGLKTLAIRMERHASNAMAVAEFLEGHARAKTVTYPGLPSHPQHELAKRQMSGFGGMVSFEVDGDLDDVKRIVSSTKVFRLAESLGGVESLIEHPGCMTHASIPEDRRKALGITDQFIRLSVGIENAEDLIDDLGAALDA